MLAVSAWYLRKRQHVESFHRTAKVALIVLIPTIVIQLSVGNQLGVIESHYQPMKIAAAEAQWNSCKPCSFSALQFGGFSQSNENATEIIPIPHLLSVLATGHVERSGHRAQPASGPVPEAVRARQLHPQRGHPVLVDADHGLPRDADPAVRAVGRLAAGPRQARTLQSVPVAVDLGRGHAVSDEHGGMAADRERAASRGSSRACRRPSTRTRHRSARPRSGSA